ncbi:hypothetical protein PV11_04157 [Exophiala sideris]|uniref:Choline transporter n=1 Tax=Exophiala sideris TaxID=1016849 RepID=A0A0D1X3A6_9EURO|nr:hypothetical protein PV11_04157 [Exophiala sideris]
MAAATKTEKSNEVGLQQPGADLYATDSIALGNSENVNHDLVQAQGHSQVLRKDFSTLASLGLGFSITNSWIGYAASFGQNIIYGGAQNAVFSLIVAAVVQSFITGGLSELASAFPSSGGQYHICYLIAPEKTKRFTAFIVGWFSIIGWWVLTCSGISFAAIAIQGMVLFWFPNLTIHPWQLYLIYLAVIVASVLPVYFAERKVPLISQVALGLSVLGCLVTFVVLLAMRQQTQPGSSITASNQGSSGWNHGFAWALGICNALYAFVATDAAVHIAEEMQRPSSQLPFILNTTILIGFVTTLPLILAMMFTVRSIDDVLASPLPSLEVYYQATGSAVAATALEVILTIIFFTAIISEWTTCSRMVWAFARDKGVPFHAYFSHIDTKKQIPVRAMFVSIIFCALYGLLYFASSTAFNSIVTSAIVFLNITYAIPQAIVLFRGRHILPSRVLDLGHLGWFCNAFSPIATAAVAILLCFPPSIPVAVSSMNYTSVVMVGLFVIVILLWFVIGRSFEGPDVDVEHIEALASRGLDGKRKLIGIVWRFPRKH